LGARWVKSSGYFHKSNGVQCPLLWETLCKSFVVFGSAVFEIPQPTDDTFGKVDKKNKKNKNNKNNRKMNK
jgi:hypothetical protein